MLAHQVLLCLVQRILLYSSTDIGILHPPWKEVPHHARLLRILPFLPETSCRSHRRRFQHQFTGGRQPRAQPLQDLGGIAWPPRYLRAMEIRDGQAAARIRGPRRFHAVLAVHARENNLPRIDQRCLERPPAQQWRKEAQKAMHDAKDRLRGLLRVRHLHRQRARMRDGPEKKLARHPRGHAQLAGLQHDVVLPSLRFIGALCAIGREGNVFSAPASHAQHFQGQLNRAGIPLSR